VTPILTFGRPAEEIVRCAEQRGVDLIAMSTHGRPDLVRMLLGSVTDRVVRTSPVPVLVVHPPTMSVDLVSPPAGRKLRVLAPIDGSTFAEEAVDLAVSLLQPDLIEVSLVNVTATPEIERPIAREILEAAAARLQERGVSVATTILEGEPANRIAGLAVTGGYDLVVMSTHGHGMLLRTLVGSITDRVLRISEVPVLVVQPRTMSAPYDPVSGENIDPDKAVYTSEYHGRTYYFTSLEHKDQFDGDPEAYVGRSRPGTPLMYEGLARVPNSMYDEIARGTIAIPTPSRDV
jgi:nucleotide-binding universal stress UspA family protein/YHS domain-containing protein